MTLVPVADAVLLSVEDNPLSVIEVTEHYRRRGAEVVEAPDMRRAEECIGEVRVDGILLDLRFPTGSRDSLRGGIEFIRNLKAGNFGRLNQDAPFIVLTSFVHEVHLDEFTQLQGFSGPVFAKATATPREISFALGIQEPPPAPDGPYFVDALITIESPPKGGQVILGVDSWPGGEQVVIPEGELPPEVREEFMYGDFPVYVWARVDIDAESPDELMPTDFRLSIAPETELSVFDASNYGAGPV